MRGRAPFGLATAASTPPAAGPPRSRLPPPPPAPLAPTAPPPGGGRRRCLRFPHGFPPRGRVSARPRNTTVPVRGWAPPGSERRLLPADSRGTGASGAATLPAGAGLLRATPPPPPAPLCSLRAALSSAPSPLRGAGPGGDAQPFGHLLPAARRRRPRPGQGPGEVAWREMAAGPG